MRDEGFTLVEMLVSMTIIALVVSITVGALHAGHRSIGSAERKIEKLERLRSALNIIDSQIQSFSPLASWDSGGDIPFFAGERDYMRFTTGYSVFEGNRNDVSVEYRVEADEGGGRSLYIKETVLNTDFVRDIKLIEGYDDIYFEYLSGDASIQQDAWPRSENWTAQWSESGAPSRIRLHLIEGQGGLHLNFVIRANAPDTVVVAR